ncbi:MAG: NrsF family protein, partial [Methylocella sp.]
MKTGDLIRALAADSEVHPMPPGRALALALIPGVAVALGYYFAVLGLRPHLLTLLGDPRLLFKLCLTILLVALSGPLVLRLVRPGAGVRRAALTLAIVPALLAAAGLAELLAVPAAEWGQRLIGSNAMFCLKTIPFLGAAPLVASLL